MHLAALPACSYIADLLLQIYDSIASNEIKMKTELCDMSKVGSDEEPRWDNLLATMGQKYHRCSVFFFLVEKYKY